MTYQTNNPVGSVDVRDLYDNAEAFDNFSAGPLDAYPDRFGVPRQSLQGIRNASQYAILGAYAAGLNFTAQNQVFSYLGEFYAPGPAITLPYTTTGVGAAEIANFRSVGDAVLRQDLANDTDIANGSAMIGRSAQVVSSITELRSLLKTSASKGAFVTGYYAPGDGGGGHYYLDTADILSADDGGTIIVAADGGRWKLAYHGNVSVLQFGAIRGGDTEAVADINREAFRKCCLSYKEDWDAWKAGKQSRSIYVPPGDYNLSNGFTVPTGCALFSDGMGTARLKVLNATADVVGVLPLVSLGRVIDSGTGLTEPSTGAYVMHPAPQIENIYLNPQNSGTALLVKDVPGFRIGKLWVQAETGVHIWKSGDGTIGDLMIEDSTGVGVLIEESQNLMFGNVYTFDNAIGMRIGTGNNNVRVAALQANYSRFFGVEFVAGSSNRSISFGSVVINQNVQHGTFTGGVYLGGNDADVVIDSLECRNANGYAAVVTGFCELSIGALKLKQLAGNVVYAQGTAMSGVLARGNSRTIINRLDSDGLYLSPIAVSDVSYVKVNGGSCRNFAAVVPVFDISAAVAGSVISVSDFFGAAGDTNKCPLYAPKAGVLFSYSNVRGAFPIAASGGRLAMFVPFNLSGAVYDITLIANTNPPGGATYRRTMSGKIHHETVFSGAVVHHFTRYTDAGPAGTVPDISLQIDYSTVGGGNDVPFTGFGLIALSLPSNYGDIELLISAY